MIKLFGMMFIITHNQVYAAQNDKRRLSSNSVPWNNPNAAHHSLSLAGSNLFSTTPSFASSFFGQFSPLTPSSTGSNLFSLVTPSPTLSYFSPGLNSSVFPAFQFGQHPSTPWAAPSSILNQHSSFTGTQSQPNQVVTFSPHGYVGPSHAAGTCQFSPHQFSPNPPTTTDVNKVISSITELLNVTYGNMINAFKAGNLQIDNFKLHCYALKLQAIKCLSEYEKINGTQIAKQSDVINVDIIGNLSQTVEILINVGRIFMCEGEKQLGLLNIEKLMSDLIAHQEITKRIQEVQGLFNGELSSWEKEIVELQQYLTMLQQHICDVTHVALEKEREEIFKTIRPALIHLGYTLK